MRWTGATRFYDHDSVALPELGSARGVWDEDSHQMFFEFSVNADPSADLEDWVGLAVSDSTGNHPDLFIKIKPFTNVCNGVGFCFDLDQAIPAGQVTYQQATPVGAAYSWTAPNTVNPSAQWTVNNQWVKLVQSSVPGGGYEYEWKVLVAISAPVDAETGQVWPNLRMYGTSSMYFQSTFPMSTYFPLLCSPTPGTNDCVLADEPHIVADTVLEHTERWPTVTTGSTSSCNGVDLMPELIGSEHTAHPGFVPGTSVWYMLPGFKIKKISGSKLWAGFHNDTTSTVASGSIEASYRIANWGLLDDWQQVATAQLSANVLAGGYAGATTFPMPGKLHSPTYVPSPTIVNDVQGLHVQLTSNGPVNFKRDSAYVRMRLIRASVFRQPGDMARSHSMAAEGQNQPMYLMVHTRNMPSVEECALSNQSLRGCADGGPLVIDTPPVKAEGEIKEVANFPGAGVEMEEEPGQNLAGDGDGPVPAPEPVQQLPADVAKDSIDVTDLPQYIVHGLQDTGIVNEQGHHILRNTASYGYYISHEGAPSQGFEHYLHVPGAAKGNQSGSVYEVPIGGDEAIAISNTIRVIDGVQTPCISWPAVGDVMPKNEEVALTEALAGMSKNGDLEEKVIVDAQFGCEAPANRGSCAVGNCPPHNPIGYIEGSAYVGQFTEEAVASVYEQAAPEDLLGSPGVGGSAGDDEPEEDLSDLPEDIADGCCAQASIEPGASARGGARAGAFALMLLLLRRGRRRRRRRS
ncbi:MAG: hypothetical protein K0V04_31145 [Deltaproteobacteria bacterium]|nr:hypothetical protein [Deltaproteobacteria bacterium]